MKLLEIACGTGRFHTFIKDNFPEMSTIAADLSPYYLARARENVRYWKSCRAQDRDLGGVDGTGSQFLQTKAEKLDLADASVDIVSTQHTIGLQGGSRVVLHPCSFAFRHSGKC